MFRTQKKFFEAAATGDMELVREYLQNSSKWAALKDKKTGETPAHRAAEAGHLAILKLLLAHNKSGAQSLNESGQSPLHLAAMNGHLDVVKELATADNRYINYGSVKYGRCTPLQYAIEGNHLEVMKVLIATGRVDLTSPPALHFAVTNSRPECVRLLLAAGADPNVPRVEEYREHSGYWNSDTRERKESPLLRAAMNNSAEMVADLLNAGAKAGQKDELPLYQAAAQGNIGMATALIQHGHDVNARMENGTASLHGAAYKNQPEMVSFLLANGAKRDVCDNSGKTPMAYAQQFALKDVIDILNADVPQKPVALKPVVAAKPVPPPAPAPEPQAPPVPAPLPEPPPPAPVFTAPAPVAAPQPAKPAGEDSEVWKLSGNDKLLHVTTFGSLGRRLTEIFNFGTRERIAVMENLSHKTETAHPPESLDAVTDAALEKAWREFTRLGGRADEATVFGQRLLKGSKLKPG